MENGKMKNKKSTGYITIRVNDSEKKHFEAMAKSMEVPVSEALRYELQNHYLGIERDQALEELKAIIKDKKAENGVEKRLDILKKIVVNVNMSVQWYKNKIKAYDRQIRRLESLEKNTREFEVKALEILSKDE
jgi:antitoxin component of RelBE/YafQ-DinJ toxin-antitoxin module